MIFRRKPDYRQIFSTKESIHKFLYADRNKTEAIVTGKDFLEALSQSENDRLVDAVIAGEALKGDIPSLTYSLRLTQLHLEAIESNVPSVPEQRRIRTLMTRDMLMFCDVAISRGYVQDPAFYGLTASIFLYNAITEHGRRALNNSLPDDERDGLLMAMNGVIKYGKAYIASNPSDAELALGARQKVEDMERLMPLISQLA